MSENAKNKLQELLDNLGCTGNCIDFQHTSVSDLYRSTVMVKFPDALPQFPELGKGIVELMVILQRHKLLSIE